MSIKVERICCHLDAREQEGTMVSFYVRNRSLHDSNSRSRTSKDNSVAPVGIHLAFDPGGTCVRFRRLSGSRRASRWSPDSFCHQLLEPLSGGLPHHQRRSQAPFQASCHATGRRLIVLVYRPGRDSGTCPVTKTSNCLDHRRANLGGP